MYAAPFSYHRAASLEEAVKLLEELGEEARVIAGGQSLIPLMKMRMARPTALIDINFISGLGEVHALKGELHIGALVHHADLEHARAGVTVPIVHDCAGGIADVQVRSQGTIGGSLAEADPSGDWGTALLALDTSVVCFGPNGQRTIPLEEFIQDAYTTALGHEEIVTEVRVKAPPKNSGGAHLAFKRSAPVYPTASASVQLTLDGKDTCKDVRIVLGCVGLTPIRAKEAEAAVKGKALIEKNIRTAVDAARAAAEPQSDMRGSADYKRVLVGALVKRAIGIAERRARGESVAAGHEYAGR
ncbi:MAG TPA: xanthine dehydrogenase family protein subunit M [Candidatus Dormibacteraeota bacterium]|nr:xanthine dehydrogenase family protein subunit M [Candidatus Dormibacteraeota bacterium]